MLLNIADMARSTYYYYIKNNTGENKYSAVSKQIQKLYWEHKGRLGYRRILLGLKDQGYVINHKTVLKLMQQMKLRSLIRGKKYQSYKGEQGKIAPNLLQRQFKASQPLQKLATDITEFKVKDKKLYLSPIIDLFNGEIISYKLSERADFKQVVDMLKKASARLKGGNKTMLHSDQGWQYQMKQYQHLLKVNNIEQSMSRKGNCLDNAIIENFFGTIKAELYYLKQYESIVELKADIRNYINYYNHKRIRLNLKGMSPVQYRAHYHIS